MVKETSKKFYLCDFCGHKYEDYDWAVDCARDCNPPGIEEVHKIMYGCDVCKDEFEDYLDANGCEQRHADNKDLKWQELQGYLEKDKLREAAAHPKQKRLTDV